MPFGPFGGVTLDTVQFSTDPEPYEPLNWAKRASVHPAIGGLVTIQDFGTFMRDNTLTLGSGGSRFLDEETVSALHERFRNRGQVYSFSDWLGNVFQVFMRGFQPVPWKQGNDSSGNLVSLWTYRMNLHVLNIVDLFGVPYTGD